jgi:D-alanyl-lipoteichoic acid acyltransferase DltB (MBOAT superfamily)
MSFQSLTFFAFLTITVAACLTAARRERPVGHALLGFACLVFALADGAGTLAALLVGTAVTALALRGMRKPRRRLALILGCGYHIAVLVVFKYTGFFTAGRLTIGWSPIGLSFFTFQQLWLLKEAYTGEYIPQRGDDLFLFSTFFPTLASGPILRAREFFSQLRSDGFLCPSWQDVSAGLYAICCGTMKKMLLADPLGAVVDNGWSNLDTLTAPAAWVVILAYTLQLYLDFSGYCDIAAGCARLLGLRLPVNFDSPYRSLSVGEFWKRWHITLTTFLRECLYFPLGGSKKGKLRTYLNILIVFLVSGFWHGAGWTFLIWGGLHGLAQIGERLWGLRRETLPKGLRWALTFLFVSLAWVFFRAPSLAAAVNLLRSAVSGGWGLPLETLTDGLLDSELRAVTTLLPTLTAAAPGLALAGLLIASLLVSLWPRNTIHQMDRFRPTLGCGLALAVLTAWSVLSFSGVSTFIYSNF